MLSRDEADPCGRVQAKAVLAVFAHDGYVLQLRVAGRVIRTTAEQPRRGGQGLGAGERAGGGDLLLTREGGHVTSPFAA